MQEWQFFATDLSGKQAVMDIHGPTWANNSTTLPEITMEVELTGCFLRKLG